MAATATDDPSLRIVWIDLELSGLDIENDVILEIACIITDSNLKEIGERLNMVINQPTHILESMVEWCQVNHRKTGLYEEVLKSTLTTRNSETQLRQHLEKYVPEGKCCLGGNSVYMDRVFLMKHMPRVNDYLHYRIIDVSSIKELCRWNRDVYSKAPRKEYIHRALGDVLESIEELKYYKQTLFNLCSNSSS